MLCVIADVRSPVVGRSDSITLEERAEARKVLLRVCAEAGIILYDFSDKVCVVSLCLLLLLLLN